MMFEFLFGVELIGHFVTFGQAIVFLFDAFGNGSIDVDHPETNDADVRLQKTRLDPKWFRHSIGNADRGLSLIHI